MATINTGRAIWQELEERIRGAREEICKDADTLAEWYAEAVIRTHASLTRDNLPKYNFRVRRVKGTVTLY